MLIAATPHWPKGLRERVAEATARSAFRQGSNVRQLEAGCRPSARAPKTPRTTPDRTVAQSSSSTPQPANDPRSQPAGPPNSRYDAAAPSPALHLQPWISALRSPIESTTLSGHWLIDRDL